MSLALTQTPSLTLPETSLIDSLDFSSISRNLNLLKKSTTLKALAEVATLLTVFAAAAIWMFVI
jgi:hypothetical protein